MLREPTTSLFTLGLHAFPGSATVSPPGVGGGQLPLSDWFPDAGILICRPAAGGALGAALKGGHNAEHHNHNDVGSYAVALAGKAPLLDPGSEVYTARTFSSRRYESGVLNSFGTQWLLTALLLGGLAGPGSSAAESPPAPRLKVSGHADLAENTVLVFFRLRLCFGPVRSSMPHRLSRPTATWPSSRHPMFIMTPLKTRTGTIV